MLNAAVQSFKVLRGITINCDNVEGSGTMTPKGYPKTKVVKFNAIEDFDSESIKSSESFMLD